MTHGRLPEFAPDWVEVLGEKSHAYEIIATPRHPSGKPGRRVRLTIHTGTQLIACETCSGSEFPASCPERHINGDGSFCLGLERFTLNAGSAARFWEALRAFLLCQEFARARRRWPTGRWLSHGREAADAQLEAEAAAAACGLGERYRRALEFRTGRLAGDLPVPAQPKTTAAASPRRRALLRLLRAEATRRRAEADFVRHLAACGQRCCGTMEHCALDQAAPASPSETTSVHRNETAHVHHDERPVPEPKRPD